MFGNETTGEGSYRLQVEKREVVEWGKESGASRPSHVTIREEAKIRHNSVCCGLFYFFLFTSPHAKRWGILRTDTCLSILFYKGMKLTDSVAGFH